MIDPRVASGLRDLPPAVMIPRERMLAAFRRVFAGFGFVPIETPHIERMEVLTGKGAGSDEVLRQIFEVTNKGGKPGELALRFDLTVPLARFVAKHIDELGTPFKRYAIGSVFRGERPAKGRFREFVQCDFDTIGTTSAVADAETAQVIHAALVAAGVPEFTITLNHRKILDGFLASQGLGALSGQVLRALDKLSKIGREAVLGELERAIDVGGPGLTADQARQVLAFVETGRGGAEVLESARATLGSNPAAAEGLAALQTVLDLLDAAGVPRTRLAIDLGLARGLDYYTGIVLETTVQGWEKFGSVASGGRYDDLASLFTTRRLPGVGASIGLDRLLALMDEAGWLGSSAATAPVLVAQFPGTDPAIPVRLAARLRAAGIGAEVFPDPIPLGKQLGYGSSRGHRLAVIVGPDEQANQVFNLRNLTTRQEDKGLAWSVLEDSVQSALEASKHQGAGL
ncbi:MAG TPA: histidine--tRNA ligase [Isosphaeraceae bacterium]|nr:histidine--tRNA ligase [Isosphaeraceae bacterium]